MIDDPSAVLAQTLGTRWRGSWRNEPAFVNRDTHPDNCLTTGWTPHQTRVLTGEARITPDHRVPGV
ncbi:MAG: hypothetical protein V5A33_07685, partial [Halobacteriales archaeon]